MNHDIRQTMLATAVIATMTTSGTAPALNDTRSKDIAINVDPSIDASRHGATLSVDL